jgi:hypothetical protein
VAAKFVLKKGSTGKYHFNLIATKRPSHRHQRELREQGQRPQRHRVGKAERPRRQGRRPNQELADRATQLASRRTRPRHPEAAMLRDGGRAGPYGEATAPASLGMTEHRHAGVLPPPSVCATAWPLPRRVARLALARTAPAARRRGRSGRRGAAHTAWPTLTREQLRRPGRARRMPARVP